MTSATESRSEAARKPRVLVVDDEPNLVEVIGDVVRRHVDCRILPAASLQEAREILAAGPVDVLVTDVHLPDGDGMTLLPHLRERQPNASAIVITGDPSLDRAVTAIRGGAIDFVTKPFNNDQLIERVRSAIERHTQVARREKRIDRLREAVKRLNDSRRLISKKVDLLCNDLVSAYGELSRQLDDVRHQDSFRQAIEKSKDLEQLLCHAMDWLLRQLGYSNVAVYLASDDGVFQLGAYMKYTIAGENIVTDAMRRVVVPLATKEAFFHGSSQDLSDRFTPQEAALLRGQDVLAVNCTYLGESLASLVFFRDEASRFTEDDVELLKKISPVFAVELASVVHETQASDAPFCENEDDEKRGELEDRENRPSRRQKKNDPADWWKRGEEPPF